MPHMMPMFWMMILLLSLLSLYFSISMFYFMKLIYPNYNHTSKYNPKLNKFLWNWKW